jgi:hypothetical protein
VLEEFEPDSQPVHLITPSSRVAPKVRAFLDHAAAALGKLDVVQETSTAIVSRKSAKDAKGTRRKANE